MENNPGKYISFLHRKGQIYWNHCLQDIDVSTAEYPVLIQLQRTDGISQEELANNQGIDKSAITRVIQSLEKKNLIMREKDGKDRRCNRIFLTAKGEATRETIERSRLGWNERLMQSRTEEEKEVLCNLLQKSVESMKEKS